MTKKERFILWLNKLGRGCNRITIIVLYITIMIMLGTLIYGANQQKATSNVTVTYSRPSYTVTFDPAGGGSSSSKIVKLGDNYGDLPTPTKTGYTFNGWQTSDGTAVTSTTQNTTIGDHTLSASWTANNYTLTLYENKNLLSGGALTQSSDIAAWTRVSGYASNTIVSEDGIICNRATFDSNASEGDLLGQNITGKLKANTEYIVGVKLKLSSPNGIIVLHIPATRTIDGVSEWGDTTVDSNNDLMYIYNKGWVDLCLHKTTRNFTSIADSYFMIYARAGFTGPLYIRDFTFAEATNVDKNITFESVNYDIAKPTYAGYTFQGYYTQPVGGTKVFNADCSAVKNVSGYTDSNGSWIKADNVKLYAQWAENSYTLTLYENKNLLNGGALTQSSDIAAWTRVSPYASNTIVSEDGIICNRATFDSNATEGDLLGQNITGKLKANTEYIIGVKLKLSSPNGSILLHIPATKTIDGVSEWGEVMSDGFTDLMNNYNKGWVDLCLHKTTINFTSIADSYFMIYARAGFTGPLYIRDFTFAEATNTTRTIKYSSSIGSVSPLTYSGFTFNGYYTQPAGGVKIYNSDGSLVKGVAGYTDSNGAWIRAEDTKLYGQWTAIATTISANHTSLAIPLRKIIDYRGTQLGWDGQGILTVTAGGGGGMWTYSVVSATTDDDDRAIPSPNSCISLSTTDATTGSVNVACQVVILEPKLLGRWNYKYIIRATSVYNGTIADIELTFDCMPSY